MNKVARKEPLKSKLKEKRSGTQEGMESDGGSKESFLDGLEWRIKMERIKIERRERKDKDKDKKKKEEIRIKSMEKSKL